MIPQSQLIRIPSHQQLPFWQLGTVAIFRLTPRTAISNSATAPAILGATGWLPLAYHTASDASKLSYTSTGAVWTRL